MEHVLFTLHPRTHITGIPQYSVVSYLRRFTDFSDSNINMFSVQVFRQKQKAPTWVDSGY